MPEPLFTEDEIYQMLRDLPKIHIDKTVLESAITDVDKFIKDNNCMRVSSYYIYEPGTKTFHKDGLFSETIFGSHVSLDRFKRFGYIELNTDILQPPIYFILSGLKSIYLSILHGESYGKFDPDLKDWILSESDDPDAMTGYNAFMEKIYDLVPPTTESKIKDGYRKVFLMYQQKNLLTTNKLLVLPAGLREITEDTMKLSRDTINQMYLHAMSLAKSISPTISNNVIFDRVRSNMQKKVYDIWSYIVNILSGDNGYIQDKFGDRNVFFGTSNVISTDIKHASSPTDPINLSPNDVELSLAQVVKAYQPFIIKSLKEYFEFFINISSGLYNLTDVETGKVVSGYLDNKISKRYTDNDSLEGILNSFQYDVFKNSEIIITDRENQRLTPMFVYDLDNIVIYENNVDSIKSTLKDLNEEFKSSNLHPITWGELLYFLSYSIIQKPNNNFAFTVRYPAIQEESNVPLKVKISTTIPSKKVILLSQGSSTVLPVYPIVGNNFKNAMSVNSLRLAGYGGDFDGDILSATGLYLEESKKEVELHYKTANSVLNNSGNFMYSIQYTHKAIIKTLSMK